jgi:hypothetical protein
VPFLGSVGIRVSLHHVEVSVSADDFSHPKPYVHPTEANGAAAPPIASSLPQVLFELFPDAAPEDLAQLMYIGFRRVANDEAQTVRDYPGAFPVHEAPGWDRVFEMWGGGQYRAYGKTERYQIKLWSKEPKLFDGESLPLVPPGTAPAKAPRPRSPPVEPVLTQRDLEFAELRGRLAAQSQAGHGGGGGGGQTEMLIEMFRSQTTLQIEAMKAQAQQSNKLLVLLLEGRRQEDPLESFRKMWELAQRGQALPAPVDPFEVVKKARDLFGSGEGGGDLKALTDLGGGLITHLSETARAEADLKKAQLELETRRSREPVSPAPARAEPVWVEGLGWMLPVARGGGPPPTGAAPAQPPRPRPAEPLLVAPAPAAGPPAPPSASPLPVDAPPPGALSRHVRAAQPAAAPATASTGSSVDASLPLAATPATQPMGPATPVEVSPSPAARAEAAPMSPASGVPPTAAPLREPPPEPVADDPQQGGPSSEYVPPEPPAREEVDRLARAAAFAVERIKGMGPQDRIRWISKLPGMNHGLARQLAGMMDDFPTDALETVVRRLPPGMAPALAELAPLLKEAAR